MHQSQLHSSTDAVYKPSDLIFSVSEINRKVKNNLETQFALVYIRGEVTGLSKPTSGHYYFSLKDAQSQLSCTLFKKQAQQIAHSHLLKDGMNIIIKAKLTLYSNRGQFQSTVINFKLEGEGLLRQQLLALKKKLSQEGLFDPSLKKDLPQYPKNIAIITSPIAAALQDFLKTLQLRYRMATITIYPSQVQGIQAAEQLYKALDKVSINNDHDLVVLCRGGGSLEDLFCFNDEMLVRKLAACPIPSISAIGHETDITMCDYAADKRAHTPTDAAIIATPDTQFLCLKVKKQSNEVLQLLLGKMAMYQNKLNYNLQKLKKKHPLYRLTQAKLQLEQYQNILQKTLRERNTHKIQRFQKLQKRLINHPKLNHNFHSKVQLQMQLEQRLQYLGAKLSQHQSHLLLSWKRRLKALDPNSVLKRGYAIISQRDKAIHRSLELDSSPFTITFSDGQVKAVLQGDQDTT